VQGGHLPLVLGLQGLDPLRQPVRLLEEERQALGLVEGQLQVGRLGKQGGGGKGREGPGQLEEGLVEGGLGRAEDVVVDGGLVAVSAVR
jgi:hypothetical protein